MCMLQLVVAFLYSKQLLMQSPIRLAFSIHSYLKGIQIKSARFIFVQNLARKFGNFASSNLQGHRAWKPVRHHLSMKRTSGLQT